MVFGKLERINWLSEYGQKKNFHRSDRTLADFAVDFATC